MVRNTLEVTDDIEEGHTCGGTALALAETLHVMLTHLTLHPVHDILGALRIDDFIDAVIFECIDGQAEACLRLLSDLLKILDTLFCEVHAVVEDIFRLFDDVLCMITDTLHIRQCIQHPGYLKLLTLAEGQLVDLDEIIREKSRHMVDQLLPIMHILNQLLVSALQCTTGVVDIDRDDTAEVDDLALGRRQGDRRGLQDTLIEMAAETLLFDVHLILCGLCAFGDGFLRNECAGKLHKKITERIKHECTAHIKNRMEDRNLHRRKHAVEELRHCEGGCKNQYSEHHSTRHVKQQVNAGSPLRCTAGTRRGNHRRHTGTDVLSEGDIEAGGSRNRSCKRQGLQDRNRSSRGLDDTGHDSTDQDAQDRISADRTERIGEDR